MTNQKTAAATCISYLLGDHADKNRMELILIVKDVGKLELMLCNFVHFLRCLCFECNTTLVSLYVNLVTFRFQKELSLKA